MILSWLTVIVILPQDKVGFLLRATLQQLQKYWRVEVHIDASVLLTPFYSAVFTRAEFSLVTKKLIIALCMYVKICVLFSSQKFVK